MFRGRERISKINSKIRRRENKNARVWIKAIAGKRKIIRGWT
jgi:hypothetical protein